MNSSFENPVLWANETATSEKSIKRREKKEKSHGFFLGMIRPPHFILFDIGVRENSLGLHSSG
jgi:hypothetical protein